MCTKLNTSSPYQIKVKVVPLHILKEYIVSRGIASLVLNMSAR